MGHRISAVKEEQGKIKWSQADCGLERLSRQELGGFCWESEINTELDAVMVQCFAPSTDTAAWKSPASNEQQM